MKSIGPQRQRVPARRPSHDTTNLPTSEGGARSYAWRVGFPIQCISPRRNIDANSFEGRSMTTTLYRP